MPSDTPYRNITVNVSVENIKSALEAMFRAFGTIGNKEYLEAIELSDVIKGINSQNKETDVVQVNLLLSKEGLEVYK